MNVLIVSLRSPTNAPRRGGAQDYIRFIGREWVAGGHAVTIVASGEQVRGAWLPAAETVDGIQILRVPAERRSVKALLAWVREHGAGYDGIIENVVSFPLLVPARVRHAQPMVVIRHHYEGLAFLKTQGLAKGLVGLALERVLEPLCYRHARYVAVSDKTRAQVLAKVPRPKAPVAVVSPAIDATLTATPAEPVPGRIVYLGALDLSRKRVDHLLEAFRTVQAQVPNAELVLAGDGPDRALLEQRAQGCRVRFEGFVDDAHKAALLASASVFASPSLTEGFGITWIEANACGVPLVGYDLGLDTVDDRCALLVPQGDVAALAQALVRVLSDDALRERLATGARENAKRFSWATSAEAFLGTLRDAWRLP